MADDLTLLTDALATVLPAGDAMQLHQAAQTLATSPDPVSWRAAAASYRQYVRLAFAKLVPGPIRAIPGADALIAALIDEALSRAEGELADGVRDLALGPATAGLRLPPVFARAPDTGRPLLVGLLPPSGMSFSLGAGPAAGGGALDFRRTPNPRLEGSFGLRLGLIGLSSLALLEDAPGGYALTTLMAARFAPGIQLGFGFQITGVGGLVGINRAVDTNALESRFRSGALADALFGDDPIHNATSVLQTLNQVFVARAGANIFGPSFQLAWLKIGTASFFRVDLGIVTALPGPSRVDVLASARAEIPLVFRLRLDIHGAIDLPRRLISVDAAIVDSHVMGIFRITGEAVFRLCYGDPSYVVLTIGGFFPGFNPAPAELPASIQRVGLALDLPIDLPLSFRAEGYLAVTSNTLQFGGRLEAGIDVELFSASGHISFDSIFQFSPFRFEAHFSAGFELKVLGETFSGVNVDGTVTGPGPVVIHAAIEYETPIFLPDISWSDTFTIGDRAPEQPTVGDLLAQLRPELEIPGNLRAENAEDRWVAVRAGGGAGGLALLAPKGRLVWSQKRAPLGLPLQRFEGGLLAREWQIDLVAPGADAAAPTERFSPGQFRSLSDAEKMNMPRFEDHAAGARISFADVTAAAEALTVAYDVYYKPNRHGLIGGLLSRYSAASLSKLMTLHDPPTVANRDPIVTLKPETWQAGGASFDTQIGAFAAAQSSGGVAHLAGDVIALGGI